MSKGIDTTLGKAQLMEKGREIRGRERMRKRAGNISGPDQSVNSRLQGSSTA